MCVCVGVFFIFIAAKQRAEVPIFSNIAWILWDFLEWDFFSFLSNMMLWVFEILGLDLCDLIFNVEIKSVYWLSKEWLFVSMALKSESLQILYWVLRYWGVRSFNFLWEHGVWLSEIEEPKWDFEIFFSFLHCYFKFTKSHLWRKVSFYL